MDRPGRLAVHALGLATLLLVVHAVGLRLADRFAVVEQIVGAPGAASIGSWQLVGAAAFVTARLLALLLAPGLLAIGLRYAVLAVAQRRRATPAA